MKAQYKHASKDTIFYKLIELDEERFPFHQLVLRTRDNFWIYCNARRYWESYKTALKEANIKIKSEIIQSELGHRIDWWVFKEEHNQREWLAIILRYLFEQNVDISATGLKNSPYFDLYTDAFLLFGKYNKALEYANISTDMSQRISYPKNKSIFRSAMKMYLCDDHKEKCEILKNIDMNIEKNIETLDQGIGECIVIVDGSNVAYIHAAKDKPSLNNVRLIDKYLQEKGFKKDNIIFIFDASFKYKVDTKDFEAHIKKDNRYTKAPAGEDADSHILTKALEETNKNPGFPPFIISNDQYKEYFEKIPEFHVLKPRKKGVTWTFILKKPKPVISFL